MTDLEEIRRRRTPTLKEGIEKERAKEEPFWSDFENPEGPFEEMLREKSEGQKNHLRWKRSQNPSPKGRKLELGWD
jgi:hypothetical protein